MIIDVTEEDIKQGVKYDCYYCPIALAAKRAFKRTEVIVNSADIWDDSVCYRLPQNAKDWIRAFDSQQYVRPFSFEVL